MRPMLLSLVFGHPRIHGGRDDGRDGDRLNGNTLYVSVMSEALLRHNDVARVDVTLRVDGAQRGESSRRT